MACSNSSSFSLSTCTFTSLYPGRSVRSAHLASRSLVLEEEGVAFRWIHLGKEHTAVVIIFCFYRGTSPGKYVSCLVDLSLRMLGYGHETVSSL